MEKENEEKDKLNKFLIGFMNKNNIEVELRYRVKDKEKLRKWLEEHAEKLYEKKQRDEYFTPVYKNYFDEDLPYEYFRIRTTESGDSTTYKHWYAIPGKREHSHCDEYETDVSSGEQLRKILVATGFRTLVVVDKHRQAYSYENFEITIDEVQEVGTVCEIELHGGFKDIKEAHEMIKNMAVELGFSESDRDEELKLGYALLIAKKKGIWHEKE